MPLYEYKCTCGFLFEDLRKVNEDTAVCMSCGKTAKRQMSRAAAIVSGGSTNETVDMKIGRDANARWQTYSDQQSKRIGNTPLTAVEAPKGNDGKFRPVMALGPKPERTKRVEYSTALQGHRKERAKKGQNQFSGVGAF